MSDYLFGTDFVIAQGKEMYHFNSDTEVLGHFIHATKDDTILDIGTNQGALLFYASRFQPKKLVGIDLFEDVLEIAQDNFKKYDLDVSLYPSRLQDFNHEPFSVIICNPPYFHTTNKQLQSDNPYKNAARHDYNLPVEDLFKNVHRLLKDDGIFYMIYVAHRKDEVLNEAKKYDFYVNRLCNVYPSIGANPRTICFAFTHRAQKDIQEEAVYLDDRSSYQRILK